MKRCFIIMPISDNEGYQNGHFGRVYEHIIKPACKIAGFHPVRADDIMSTNYIALDVIKNIIECEMAICDLSSQNPNVLYELGIRQAFNLPVALIKDQKTDRIFDIQGFRDVEYDESLRIDNVEDVIETLSETLKNTYENTNEVNSLVSLLAIEPAKISERKLISTDTGLLLEGIQNIGKRIAELEVKFLPTTKISKGSIYEVGVKLENVGDLITELDIDNLKIGDRVYHERFGVGVVNAISKTGIGLVATLGIDFNIGRKNLVLKYAKLRKYT